MISHEHGIILVNVPFNGTYDFETEYVKRNYETVIASNDTRKNRDIIEKKELGKIISQFYDYELFTITKSPYLRAYEMFVHERNLVDEKWFKKLTIGKFYEGILNRKIENKTEILKQIDYCKSQGNYFGHEVNFEVNHKFQHEKLSGCDFTDINNFLRENDANTINYMCVDVQFNQKWDEEYDEHSIEIVNYLFEEDFEFGNYRKL